MTPTISRRLIGGILTLGLATALVTGCSDDEPTGGPTASGSSANSSASPVKGGQDVAAVTKKAFDIPEARKPIGSATGTIVRQEGQQTAEILSVETGASGTYLSWRLKSADGAQQSLKWQWGVAPMSEFEPNGDLRAIRIITADGTYYLATTFDRKQRAPESSTYCLCSPMPQTIPAGEGIELYGYYPPLPADIKSVTVQIAGLPDITNVPVTKAE